MRLDTDHPLTLIADIGSNHDGSLDRARSLVELAVASGADYAKIQQFSASTIVSRRGFAEVGRIGHQAAWSLGVYETYEAASVPPDWIPALATHCRECGIGFLTTPYSVELADAVDPFVEAFKIGSGDVTWLGLIEHLATKGKPLIVATGASTANEVRRAVRAASEAPAVTLLQCNSDYANPELRYSNLRVLAGWQRQYPQASVGLSDHTLGRLAACAAVALGATTLEKHFTDDRTRSGPDHAFAMEPHEWREMVEAVYDVWSALGDGEKKVEENEREARVIQRRALRWKASLSPGMQVRRSEVIATRPCPEGALEPYRIEEVVDRVVARDVEPDTLVRLEDFK